MVQLNNSAVATTISNGIIELNSEDAFFSSLSLISERIQAHLSTTINVFLDQFSDSQRDAITKAVNRIANTGAKVGCEISVNYI